MIVSCIGYFSYCNTVTIEIVVLVIVISYIRSSSSESSNSSNYCNYTCSDLVLVVIIYNSENDSYSYNSSNKINCSNDNSNVIIYWKHADKLMDLLTYSPTNLKTYRQTHTLIDMQCHSSNSNY